MSGQQSSVRSARRRRTWLAASLGVAATVTLLTFLLARTFDSSDPSALDPTPVESSVAVETSPAIERSTAPGARETTAPVLAGQEVEEQKSVSSRATALRAYRDPVTGELTSPPPGPAGRVTQPVFAPQNRSHAGLYEEVTPNGVKVDFQGRFFTASIATRDEDGNITVRPGAPSSPESSVAESKDETASVGGDS